MSFCISYCGKHMRKLTIFDIENSKVFFNDLVMKFRAREKGKFYLFFLPNVISVREAFQSLKIALEDK